MNILWITHKIFPAPSKALGIKPQVLGGWLYGLGTQIAASPGICMAVATTYSGKQVKKLEIGNTIFYLLPEKSNRVYQKHLEVIWKDICDEFKPDVVHVHGTEYSNGLACMRVCPELNFVVSIQGLVSVCARYFYAGMSTKDIITNITFRDIIRRDTIFQRKKNFESRGRNEREYFQRTRHVIGRTNWDYAHAKSINPNVEYHMCNESLRDDFYSTKKWDVGYKKNYSIFLSQSNYPIKGVHQVFKAIMLLRKEFPEITIRIGGGRIINNTTFSEKIRLSGYGNYIRKMINKEGLQNNVLFLGVLNEQQMIEEYRNAHMFICPSSIENSPNSVGEAQILGTPVVASYVGGVPDMVSHGETGLLYRFEEVEMLAENIRTVFNDDDLAVRLSLNGIVAAEQRHDRQTNLSQTLRCYSKINS